MQRKPLNELTMIIAHPGRDTILKTRRAAEELNIRVTAEAPDFPSLCACLSKAETDLISLHILLPGLAKPFGPGDYAFSRLRTRPAVLYAAPARANAHMTEGFHPVIPACPTPEELSKAVSFYCPPSPDAEEIARAGRVFAFLGIPEGRALDYLSFAAGLCLIRRDCARELSKTVYPETAEKFGVSQKHVSDAMRRSIDKAFLSGDIDRQYALFQNTIDETRGKPTLSALLARVSDILRLKEDEHLC